MIPGLAKLVYEDGLRKLDLPTLAFRRISGDMIEMFKYMNGIYKVDCSNMQPRHEIGRLLLYLSTDYSEHVDKIQ